MTIIIDGTNNSSALAVHGAFYCTSEGVNGLQYLGFGDTPAQAYEDWNLVNSNNQASQLPIGYSITNLVGVGYVAWDDIAYEAASPACQTFNEAAAHAWKHRGVNIPKIVRD